MDYSDRVRPSLLTTGISDLGRCLERRLSDGDIAPCDEVILDGEKLHILVRNCLVHFSNPLYKLRHMYIYLERRHITCTACDCTITHGICCGLPR